MDFAEALEKARNKRDQASYLAETLRNPGLVKIWDEIADWLSKVIYLAEKGLAALREQEQSKWISVKERLPEKDECVWCFSNKNGGYMFIGYRGWLIGEWMERGSMHIADVTHWMPLPEPPEVIVDEPKK